MRLSFRSLTLRAALVALVFSFVGCDKEPAQSQQPGASPDSLLAYVPADTSYVLGNVTPLPKETVTKVLAIYQEAFGWYRQLLSQQKSKTADSDEARMFSLLDSFLAEFQDNASPEGLARMGLRTDGRTVVYGQGLYPVGRHEIADSAKLWELVGRVEGRFGEQAPRGQFGSVSYLDLDLGALRFVLGTPGKQLVWALVPSGDLDRYLPLLFGDQRPDKNLLDSGRFQNLLSEYGLPGYGDGYLDLQGLFALLKNTEFEASSLAAKYPGCVALVDDLLTHVPRMVVGTKDASAKRLSQMTLLETDSEVGAMLSELAYPVPGVGRTSQGLFAMGVGLQVPKLRGALRSLINYLGETGTQCKWVDRQALEGAMPQLEMALGPMTAMFKGLYIELLDLKPSRGGSVPAAVKLRALAEVDDPQGVFAMTGMFSPELARLEIPSDGTPKTVPADLLPPAAPPVVVAIKDNSLVIAAGGDGAALATGLLAEKPLIPAPLLSITYNFQRLGSLFTAAAEQYIGLLAAQGEKSPEELRRELETTAKIYQLYKSASMTMSAGKSGFRVDQELEFR